MDNRFLNVLVISQSTETKLAHSEYARNFYTGDQHNLVKEGVGILRKHLGAPRSDSINSGVDWNIISPEYGLAYEYLWMKPYDLTMNDIRRTPERLKVHNKLSQKLQFTNYDLVFFILDNVYLQTLQIPVSVKDSLTQIFFLDKDAPKSQFRPPGGLDGHMYPFAVDPPNLTIPLEYSSAPKEYLFRELCKYIADKDVDLTLHKIKENPRLIANYVKFIRTGLDPRVIGREKANTPQAERKDNRDSSPVDEWKISENQRLDNFVKEALGIQSNLTKLVENPEYKDHYITEGMVDSVDALNRVLTYLLFDASNKKWK